MEAFFFGILMGLASNGMPTFIDNASPYMAYSSVSDISADYYTDEVESCTSGVTPAQQAELQRLSELLTKHGESLDNLATNKHLVATLGMYREELISMIDSANYRCGTSYDDYIQALTTYIELVKVAKQQTPTPLTQPRDDLMASQRHLATLSNVVDLTKALSSTAKLEGMVKYDNNTYDKTQPNTFHLDGSLALDTVLNAPAKAIGLTTNLSFTNMTTSTPTSWTGDSEGEWTEVVGTPVSTDTKGNIKAHLMMIDNIFYGSVDTFDVQTTHTGSQAQLSRIKETFAPYSDGTYAKVASDKEITDLMWQMLSQTGSSDFLANKPLIDFYHTDGNTSYGVISSQFCQAMGEYAATQLSSYDYDETDTQDIIDSCLTQQAYALLLTNNKGYITLTRDGDTTYLGLSPAYITNGQQDILTIPNNTKAIGWDTTKLTHLNFPITDENGENTPFLTYNYPNLSIAVSDPDDSTNTFSLNGTITDTNTDLKGTLSTTDDYGVTIKGSGSLSATYDNDTYSTHLVVNGTYDDSDLEYKSSLAIDVKATETLSTTNVPSITAPTKTQDVTLFVSGFFSDFFNIFS